jgi:hypothetical protein
MKTVRNKLSPVTQVDLLAVLGVMDKSNDIINSLQNLFFIWVSLAFFLWFFETRCDASQPLEIGFPGSEVVANQGSLTPELRQPLEIDSVAGMVMRVTPVNFGSPFFHETKKIMPPIFFGVDGVLFPSLAVTLPLTPLVERVNNKPANDNNDDSQNRNAYGYPSWIWWRGWRWYHWAVCVLMCFLSGGGANTIWHGLFQSRKSKLRNVQASQPYHRPN